MSSPPLISLQGVAVCYPRRRSWLRKTRDGFWALKDVTFELHHNEVLAVIGRNGAGKSTLLQVLGRILVPDRGKIRIADCRASLLSAQVGFVSQLSGRDNATLSGMLLGLSRREIRARMEDIIAFAELEDFIDEPIATYSTGMRARLGFAVALQLDADVYLIDEALGVGDAEFRLKSTAALREKIARGKAAVVVSHDPDVLRELCSRAVWLESGISRRVGAAAEVLDEYLEVHAPAAAVPRRAAGEVRPG